MEYPNLVTVPMWAVKAHGANAAIVFAILWEGIMRSPNGEFMCFKMPNYSPMYEQGKSLNEITGFSEDMLDNVLKKISIRVKKGEQPESDAYFFRRKTMYNLTYYSINRSVFTHI